MADGSATSDQLGVLFVHTATLPPLGADTWIHVQIIRHLDRSTHQVHVACRTDVHGDPTATYRALQDVPDVHVRPVNLGTELSGRSRREKVAALIATIPAVISVIRLVAYVRRRRITVIHTSDRPRDAFVSILVARLTGATSIVHVHVAYNPDWMGWMLRWSLEHADALIAVSEFVGGTLVEGGHRPERVRVVLNAIDVSAWVPGAGRAAVRDELAIAESTAVVTIVCRLFAEKGPGDLIRAIGELRADVPDVRLLVVGQSLDSPFGVELVTLVEALGLDEHVSFLGRREDVPAVMAAAEVYAMPSFHEPFGLVFCEAMAMRLPVVALADGGTLEVVEHGKSGLLSDRGDIPQLTSNLRTLLSDDSLRVAMGELGRRRVEERFTVERMARETAAVYRLVASAT